MHRQKQQALDNLILKGKTTPKKISPGPRRQRIVVEEDKERDFHEAIVEGNSPSK